MLRSINRLINININSNRYKLGYKSYHANRFCSISTSSTTPSSSSGATILESIKNNIIQDIENNSNDINSDNRKFDVKKKLENVPSLNEFMKNNIDNQNGLVEDTGLDVNHIPPYLEIADASGEGRSVFVESYGCQMNFADTEIVYSVMRSAGYTVAESAKSADIVFLNTCAIRENAEDKIWFRLSELRKQKRRQGTVIGVLGCMAERLKQKLLESNKSVDLVVGPDAYRSLPSLLSRIEDGDQTAINVMLSADETYADIAPIRTNSNGVSAYVSIMRGCNNMCSYCIVPFTRGRERSRSIHSIVDEVKQLSADGYKEITLLGQNVNSYNFIDEVVEPLAEKKEKEVLTPREGFNTIYKSPKRGVTFTELMDKVSLVDPEMRIRFTSPHPKDFPDALIELIKQRPNICQQLHIPAQSGNTEVLERMRRGYSRESYLQLIDLIRRELPDAAISSDFISGFCGETESEHRDTISLLNAVGYENAFMFMYSLREKTHAHRTMADDVDVETKTRRLQEVIDTFYSNLRGKSKAEIGRRHLVLVDRISRRSKDHFVGRTDTNKKVIIPNTPIVNPSNSNNMEDIKPGDYIMVDIVDGSEITLQGKPICKSGIQHFKKNKSIL
ncbi:hypothetical protein PPL_05496 [Heterostelium album PN500]|uniref:Uncharacterized protein n=1 Tax=Heterostelium pallidum (strain ATCC 26659 / Pp 5 / PN500) TaxID=670386 RepID=D3BAC0_HETP5|nr:hypothetical protein PPL_05496 [Heterostelium album PN500]EFA81507.1 hypothetical protein PPL_05496 [Heterostelium album PN500]|eukprot:XP_020433624.1 hypothetical protein PPL_05496 [Heterostelium album PN500]